MKNSAIEWTDHTFNPWIGCSKVSTGCENCYAETLNNRMKWTQWGPGGQRFRTGQNNWNEPIRWNAAARKAREAHEGPEIRQPGDAFNQLPETPYRRPRVFCASLADWLDDKVPTGWRRDLLSLIEKTPELDWLLLTKRPQNWAKMIFDIATNQSGLASEWLAGRPPANVWLGVSAEDQIRWDKRVPRLLEIPARVRFVSAEPLIGPIIMGKSLPDWVIVGGESGPGAREIAEPWVRSLRQESADRGVAFFFKQWGGTNKKETGRELDGLTFSAIPNPNTR